MLFKKLCPVCDTPLNKYDIFRSGYKWEYQTITCKKCNSKLKPNWNSAIAWMFICILPAAPLFNAFETSNYLGIVLLLATSAFVLLPLSIMVGLYKVKIETINE